jgi:hypothetical protein
LFVICRMMPGTGTSMMWSLTLLWPQPDSNNPCTPDGNGDVLYVLGVPIAALFTISLLGIAWLLCIRCHLVIVYQVSLGYCVSDVVCVCLESHHWVCEVKMPTRPLWSWHRVAIEGMAGGLAAVCHCGACSLTVPLLGTLCYTKQKQH